MGKAEFRNRRDLIPEFLGIPCIYGDVGKAEFRNRRDLIPGAESIPECSTSRNRMCSRIKINELKKACIHCFSVLQDLLLRRSGSKL